MTLRPLRWTARSVALFVLVEARKKDSFVQELLETTFASVPLSPADRGLATQLVYGIFRRRGTLDVLLRHVVARPPRDVEPILWEALRLGVYQLLFLSRVPAYSAINETVELAVDFGLPRAKGFLNGNLRSVTRLLTDQTTTAPAANSLPISPDAYRRLSEPALPDPRVRPVEYASVGLSLPDWLVRRWLPRFGWDELIRLGFWFGDQPGVWLRTNPMRTDRDAYLSLLKEKNVEAFAGDHPQSIGLAASAPIRDLPGYDDGLFVVQDLSAMRVASALGPKPGQRILDLCAAPGGKSTHLAELMNDQGQIVACDRDAKRLEPLRASVQRLGLKSLEIRVMTEDEEPPLGPFDAALVDVPCSNTGVLGRRPEARWRLSDKEISRMPALQSKLLTAALSRVKPGGVVVYSTCSIEPEENGQVITSVMQSVPGTTLEADELSRPGHPSDGGYWARLRRDAGLT